MAAAARVLSDVDGDDGSGAHRLDQLSLAVLQLALQRGRRAAHGAQHMHAPAATEHRDYTGGIFSRGLGA